MLNVLLEILEARPDAYTRALAAAEEHIDRSGGAWAGVGTKGSVLLLKAGSYADPLRSEPYIRAGTALLDAALERARDMTGTEAHALRFVAGCAYAAAATAGKPEHYDLARANLAESDFGREDLPDWCADWCAVLLSEAARESGDPEASKAYFQQVSERDPKHAAQLYETWAGRKG
ncbi:hypothetical protein [Pacificoceanicola onchidii]|uniref:hypothetical protein n=1 Tax=Pacificoceanicola onchidii TaxID=2562685 RepID=UPI0010A69B9F|nr:hypothetical protein [Pacificoceanicola onchidii]